MWNSKRSTRTIRSKDTEECLEFSGLLTENKIRPGLVFQTGPCTYFNVRFESIKCWIPACYPDFCPKLCTVYGVRLDWRRTPYTLYILFLWYFGIMILWPGSCSAEPPAAIPEHPKSMFGGQTLSYKGHFFDDSSLLFSTVPKGTLFKKTPCLIKKLTLFAIKSGLQTYS